MKYNPHDYQTYATNFVLEHPVAAVLLEMGLGKSVITLTAIFELLYNRFEVGKVLVIAPLRVARDTWPAEIEKWDHLKGLTYSVVIGTESERKEALRKSAGIYLINRENVDWLINKSGFPFDFDMVVIDELSSFKSASAKRFKSLLKVRPKVKRIVGLTGTPSSNGLMDLWAEFRILDMGERLGRYITHYRMNFFVPDKRNQQMIFSYKPRPGAEDAIYRLISDITISMKSADFLKMPECIMNEVEVKLSEKEWSVYDELRQEMVVSLEDEEIDAANAAALSGKLLQMANGAIYNEEKEVFHIHDRKLDALEDLIEGANGKPVLVAYWYNHDLERIRERFKVREIKTSKDIKDWNNGEIPIAVIHPASAGHGLNLQSGGSTLIWFGLTWSLELYQQTNARLWRQGQKSTVVIHHIITKDTIDEDSLQSSITNSAGAAQQMADTQLDNLQGQLTILKSALEGLAISFGELLMPAIKSIVGAIQGFVDWLNSMDEGTKKVIVTIALVVAAIGPVLIIVGKVISAVGTIMTIIPKLGGALKAVQGAMAAFNAVCAANPYVLIIAAIVALIAIFVVLWNKCDGFRQFWINLWEGIKSVVSTVVEAIKNFFTEATMHGAVAVIWKIPNPAL